MKNLSSSARLSSLDLINTRVRNLPPYVLKSLQAEVKVNQNESPFDFPAELKETVFARMRAISWSRYPEFFPQNLIRRISERFGWKEEGILVGNGSNEIILALFLISLDRGKRLLISQPTFPLYKLIGGILGAAIVEAPLTGELEFDTERMCHICRTEHIDVVALCSPNNPTGCQLAETDLRHLLDAHRGLFLLDEAYCEFAPTNMFSLLREFPNLIITRTFSKAAGIAGLRLGYCMGDPVLIEQASKAKLPYSVNTFSLTAAEVLFDDYHQLQDNIRLLIAERVRLLKAMQAIPGIQPYDSKANFVFFRVKPSASVVFEKLLAQNILVRDVSRYPLLQDGLRVSIGRPEENDRFLAALTEICRG
jgi:histidinol-phosphate aminotransferase